MTALELQSEYQSLVSRIANEDYETISKAVNALKKILSPNKAVSTNKTKTKKITRADLVIDPRIAAMTKGINSPDSFDYKEEYYKDYMK
jgi:ethanolamine utilization protein EutP (predicted NTPase)